jgi:uncharacterized membrane protein AbrB (regulator of aidB expression)
MAEVSLWTIVFNITMIVFAVLLFWVAYDRRIHTGFLGALGAAGGGIQALRSMDDSVLHTVAGTRSTMLIFVWCMFVLVGNVVYSLWRAGAFRRVFQGAVEEPAELGVQPANAKSHHPWRRRTDFSDFDSQPHYHDDQRSAA